MEKIIEELAKKYQKPKEVIDAIVKSQFQFVKKVMVEGDRNDITTMKNVRLLGLGCFICRTNLSSRNDREK